MYNIMKIKPSKGIVMQTNPYTEDPEDMRSVCVSPDGSVLGGNINVTDISDITESYAPVGVTV